MKLATQSFPPAAGVVADGIPLLRASGIVKTFGGNRALSGVSIDVRPNEVVALVGDNGAGKSTLVKILSGAELPDEARSMSAANRR